MSYRLPMKLGLVLLVPVSLWCQSIRIHTNIGDIDVTLYPNAAPKTVANFMAYVSKGTYNRTVIHRVVPSFVIQGGGYSFNNGTLTAVTTNPFIQNEYNLPNTRGTIAMAKLSSCATTTQCINPADSATSQWYFNVVDNSVTLGPTNNGGFTVFGRIANAAGLALMDKISGLPTGVLSSPYDQMPIIDNTTGKNLTDANVVLITSVEVLTAPSIASAGVVSASNFGGQLVAAPGSYIEIYGQNLAGTSRGWASADFRGANAPTSLDGVSVTINGQVAYVNYVSPGQINVQVPSTIPAGLTLPVIVTYNGVASAPVSIATRQVAGGLLAPASFKVGSNQYVVALHADNTFVTSGNIAGISGSPAKPGETLTLYGTGFGRVDTNSVPIAGQIAQNTANIVANVQVNIGQSQATLLYAGIAPGLVGVYQFNVTVPSDAPNGDLPLTVTVNGDSIAQTNLLLPVQAAKN